MRIKLFFTSVRVIIIGFVFIVGVIAGTIALNNISAETSNQSISTQVPPKDENGQTIYPKNKNGQTYGSAAYATTPDNEPDLIEAWGVDGDFGYVKSSDLYGEKPKTPEEAIAKQNREAEEGDRIIPLYASDGVTVIGSFKISVPGTMTRD